MRKFKKIEDSDLVELNEKFAMLNLNDRDNTIFNYEADVSKIIKKINIKRIIDKDKKYLRKIKNVMLKMAMQSYLKDMIIVGLRKKNRFISYFTEPA